MFFIIQAHILWKEKIIENNNKVYENIDIWEGSILSYEEEEGSLEVAHLSGFGIRQRYNSGLHQA